MKDVPAKGASISNIEEAATSHSRRAEDDSFSTTVEAVTAVFGDRTRREIYIFVRDNDEATVAVVAEQFSLHPNVARHHLDKLAAAGYLEASLVRAKGPRVGRPSKSYSASTKQPTMEVPPRRDDLLVTLLAKTIALIDPKEAERVAEEVGEQYGRNLAKGLSPECRQRSIRASLSVVADALTAHGFAAHAEARGASLAIISDHCPFGNAASQSPVICAVDRGIIKGMLASLSGQSVDIMTSSKARGDRACAVVV